MSAPTPWSGPLPLLFTGSFQKGQFGRGNLYVGSYTAAGGGGTVFDNLINPPAGGVTAESFSLSWAQGVGTTSLVSSTNGKPWWTGQLVTNMVKKNYDFVMQFYLAASIARSGGVPIA